MLMRSDELRTKSVNEEISRKTALHVQKSSEDV